MGAEYISSLKYEGVIFNEGVRVEVDTEYGVSYVGVISNVGHYYLTLLNVTRAGLSRLLVEIDMDDIISVKLFVEDGDQS